MTQPLFASEPHPALAAEILDFWLCDGLVLDWPSEDLNRRWFLGGAALDDEIRGRFGQSAQVMQRWSFHMLEMPSQGFSAASYRPACRAAVY